MHSLSQSFLFFSIQLLIQHPPDKRLAIDFEAFEGYGNALTGVFSIVSVYLIYRTLTYQADTFNLTQFENRVFELIRYHRDNVAIIKMRAPDKVSEVYYEGHKALREIHKQMNTIISIIEHFFNEDLSYKKNLNDIGTLDKIAVERNVSIQKLDKFNVAYLCLFFGMSEEGQQSLRNILSNRYNENLIDRVIGKLENIFAVWQRSNANDQSCSCTKMVDEVDSLNKTSLLARTKYYGGHQYRLGHYFRHLYQIIVYIDENDKLTYSQKYKYVKIVRAQLSTYEQTLLFFNSISNLGRTWELDVDLEKKVKASKISDYKIYNGLITKYNLIRNIPNEFITNISISEIYPHLTFEGSFDTEVKKHYRDIYNRKRKHFFNY